MTFPLSDSRIPTFSAKYPQFKCHIWNWLLIFETLSIMTIFSLKPSSKFTWEKLTWPNLHFAWQGEKMSTKPDKQGKISWPVSRRLQGNPGEISPKIRCYLHRRDSWKYLEVERACRKYKSNKEGDECAVSIDIYWTTD